ncbi:Com family DNA-binding transcriptional regulator [Hydrogenophaga taeniospiralis]|uniref:Com family DNA-binding transcriptional regulator n=1 Tax=Hydrogenophaga taeniospiralis TaxID=65656 RepID=UPI001CFBE2ED|nr:Com family DNA-binding transcriptional regulator [Hydrogenophaga taeniospiralis]UCU94032.1 Com family DNA-binding transcriptional regulator [Hydrogenophaga taeniospiralis]
MNEIRCGSCRRKLGEGTYTVLTIKCPRCGGMNHLRAESPQPACHRAPDQQHNDGTQTDPPRPRPGRQGPPHAALDRWQAPPGRPDHPAVP